MADPICRWRNPFLHNDSELISILPKEEMTKEKARDITNARSHLKGDFYKTPYQLACQLGLYYENNGRYFPKFIHQPTEQEIFHYLQNWIKHYSVPNPYTKGFENLQSLSAHAELCRKLFESRAPIEWINTTAEIFNTTIGNEDILRNSIKSYSPVISIIKGMIVLKEGRAYEDLVEYIDVDVLDHREDKEYFFDLFPLPINSMPRNGEVDFNTQPIQAITAEIRNTPTLTETEKQQIISARIGQGIFRRNLIADCGFCPISLVDDTNLLIASHIKPWRISNNEERIDFKNGILLAPTYDRLFDRGLISFTNSKELIISTAVSEENRQRLNIIAGTIHNNLPLEGREEYLQFHRDHIFKN